MQVITSDFDNDFITI